MLFPNPASDDLNIEIESDIKQMVIYNEQGQQVFLGTQKKENISCLNNGVYTIKIEDEQGEIRTTKFLKK
ncbi:T9SS type A sorting domain-containing protein [Flavobacterium davisii]|uniref:T9SS type A sorting domain-containing protein n=1 Tax=Flavobacterium columnare TaxID=996 RepID=A0A8G0KZM3_9FLAO|nr:T9SS type A sorting domain-containing protein [Flavobacterium davisii]